MRWSVYLMAGCVAASACEGGRYDGLPVITSRVEMKDLPIPAPRAIDLLFVVDNSPAMAGYQPTWLANQRNMISVLNTIEGGLPNMHIGVVTTDLGTLGNDDVVGPAVGGDGPGSCSGNGDGGVLHGSRGRVLGSFISDRKLQSGARAVNYTGDLYDAFAEIATVGTEGCAYVQPLEAMRRALVHPLNAGFLRREAELAVVFITPNDDCSFARGGFAVESAAVNARICTGRVDELVDVDAYASELRGLKANPTKIMVTGILGPSQPHALEVGPEGVQVAPSCTYEGARALPATRLKALLDGFPNRNTYTTICQHNWADGIAVFGGGLWPPRIGDPCFYALPFDTDPDREGLQPDCTVAYRYDDGSERAIEACSEGVKPCWRIVEKPQWCPTVPSLALDVLHADEEIYEDVHVIAQCLVQ